MPCTSECRSFLSSPTTCLGSYPASPFRLVPTSFVLLLNTRDHLFRLAYPRPPVFSCGSSHPRLPSPTLEPAEFSLSFLPVLGCYPRVGPLPHSAEPALPYITAALWLCLDHSINWTHPNQANPFRRHRRWTETFLRVLRPGVPRRAPSTIQSSGPWSPATPLASGPLLP